VFHDGFLTAILVQLSDQHETNAGKWFLEAGFRRINDMNAPLFKDRDAAQAWIADKLR
jgi:hypothetical protein